MSRKQFVVHNKVAFSSAFFLFAALSCGASYQPAQGFGPVDPKTIETSLTARFFSGVTNWGTNGFFLLETGQCRNHNQLPNFISQCLRPSF